ncbi:hypothetical protein GSI_09627 [Ganoderma sinense ZZ0214-1]|uniref:Uncharacterized protein n=1 Tax=Ganoderma sinense ZZ0214-1 TaxID=1077348 RepID=A0A2G8S368_9APHY|nr:hypothetical protein GSI_09627 [Ganoderma sinense ZZ0214-1]
MRKPWIGYVERLVLCLYAVAFLASSKLELTRGAQQHAHTPPADSGGWHGAQSMSLIVSAHNYTRLPAQIPGVRRSASLDLVRRGLRPPHAPMLRLVSSRHTEHMAGTI